MPGGPLDKTLTIAERRAVAPARRQPINIPNGNNGARRCAFCNGPLANGSAVCSPECDDGLWDLIPTQDGTLWT